MSDLFYTEFDNVFSISDRAMSADIHKVDSTLCPEFWGEYEEKTGSITRFNNEYYLMSYPDFMRAAGYFEEYCFKNSLEDLSIHESFNLIAF